MMGKDAIPSRTKNADEDCSSPMESSKAFLRKVRSLDSMRRTASSQAHHHFRSKWGGHNVNSFFLDGDHDSDFFGPTTVSCQPTVASKYSQSVREKRLGIRRRSRLSLVRSEADFMQPGCAAVEEADALGDVHDEEGSESVGSDGEPQTIVSALFSRTVGVLRRGHVVNMAVLLLLMTSTADLPSQSSSGVDTSKGAQHGQTVDAYRSQSSAGDSRPRLGLGSAMIGSLTNVLSPILPFAGGVDLRREEHWSWHDRASMNLPGYDLVSRCLSTMGMGLSDFLSSPSVSLRNVELNVLRGGAQPSMEVANSSLSRDETKAKSATSSRKRQRSSTPRVVVAAPTSFLVTDKIELLTLEDMSTLFFYAMESGRSGFDKAKFRGKHKGSDSMALLAALDAMDEATASSRGKDVASAQTSARNRAEGGPEDPKPLAMEAGFGDIDALQFCAAMRLLAEWRMVRQVPNGYKGYAVGMSLGHKDIVQNLAKIETSANEWVARQIESGHTPKNGPTLRQLLQEEIELDLHPTSKLPRLKEKSAAMGLLWVMRQLLYQIFLFENIIRVPSKFDTTILAISAAYTTVYGPYHGWAVQKIFNYSFQAAPAKEVIYRHMNPEYLRKVETAIANGLKIDGGLEVDISASSDEPRTETQPDRVDSESSEGDKRAQERNNHNDLNPLEKLGRHIGGEWDKLANNVSTEWDKLATNVGRIFDKDIKKEENSPVCAPTDDKTTLPAQEIDRLVTEAVTEGARQHIVQFLTVVKPLLGDLAGLMDEMNMNDPSKV